MAVILAAVPGLFQLISTPSALGQAPSSVAEPESATPETASDEAVEESTEATVEEQSSDEEGHSEGHGTEGESHGDEHHEGEHGGGHSNVAAPLFAAIVLILLLAKVVGDLFERVGMPAVLGELSVGILLGNIALITTSWIGVDGWHGLDFLQAPEEHSIGDVYNTGAALKMLAEIGVVLLLFEVGLESNVKEMMKVGVSSLFVAILGVVAPMILGVGVGWFLLQHEPWQVSLFLGATLCATSVGITARVLKDLGKSQQRESQIILGAAVIDDVLGLIILTVVSGIIEQGDAFSISSLIEIVVKSVGFLAAAILLGSHLLVKPLFKAASFLRGHGLLVSTALVICFGLAFLANLVGLAPIVGAFAAGLILEKAHYQNLGKKEHAELEEALAPLTALLVPIFFVQMGIMVDLSSFGNSSVWMLAGAITVAAVIGKQVCSLGVIEKGLNKVAIGLGMIPRGEVGLIFASVGAGLMVKGEKVVSDDTYSAIIVMVIITTMVTPPLLKWSLSKPAPGAAE
ncbi:cation:proton antiporter [Thalassoglobus sp. JC818]|uniref:cation:proton antiporter n=1 Tax=Thalassoglobus sp. JC818 TaxID=3232136 RepID=UPI00345935A8